MFPDSLTLLTNRSPSHTVALKDRVVYFSVEIDPGSWSGPTRMDPHGRPDELRVVIGRKSSPVV